MMMLKMIILDVILCTICVIYVRLRFIMANNTNILIWQAKKEYPTDMMIAATIGMITFLLFFILLIIFVATL